MVTVLQQLAGIARYSRSCDSIAMNRSFSSCLSNHHKPQFQLQTSTSKMESKSFYFESILRVSAAVNSVICCDAATFKLDCVSRALVQTTDFFHCVACTMMSLRTTCGLYSRRRRRHELVATSKLVGAKLQAIVMVMRLFLWLQSETSCTMHR